MKELKKKHQRVSELLCKNIDQHSKPLKGSVEFLIGQKIKIFLWEFVQINRKS